MDAYQLVSLFLISRRARQRRPATIEWYRVRLMPFIRECGGELPSSVDRVERFLGAAVAYESAAGRLRALAAFYRWCGQRGHVDRALVREWFGPREDGEPALLSLPRRRRPLPRVFSRAELVAIFRAAEPGLELAAVTVLLDTGLRIGELAGLCSGDLEPGALRCDGKTGPRVVPCSPASMSLLLRLSIPGPRSPLFRTRSGRAFGSDGLQARVVAVLHRAGIGPPRCGPHTLRHTFATMYIRNGGEIHRLQRILGHSELKTTLVYVHLAGGDLAEEHARVTPLRDVSRWVQLELVGFGAAEDG